MLDYLQQIWSFSNNYFKYQSAKIYVKMYSYLKVVRKPQVTPEYIYFHLTKSFNELPSQVSAIRHSNHN
uniref:Uncharacterized protein n=1 Tax=Arundo donax TaxID=35708 RepID=A0A0A9E750_ARUDO